MRNKITVFLNTLRRRHIMARSLSMLLSLLLIFYAVPSIIYAETIEALGDSGQAEEPLSDAINENKEGDGSDEIDIYTYQGVAYEVEELREESAKHFRLEDGSYVAAQYSYPVHYVDGSGEYRDIDNSLTESSGGVYANASARIKFAKKITGNETLFALHDGSTKLTLSLIGAKKKTVGTVTNNSDAEDATELQKMMNLEKLSSRIIYEDILDGVDIEYIADSLNIKENIIVKEKKDSYSYSFELALNGLTARLVKSGDVVIYEGESVKYTIPAPVVFDNAGVYALDEYSGYVLEDLGNGKYTLIVTVSDEWMNAEERVYPVTVDPTLYTSYSLFKDTTIDSLNPTTSNALRDILTISSNQTLFWKTSFLPNVKSGSYVYKAELGYYCIPGVYSQTIGAFKVLDPWIDGITYNSNNVAIDPVVLDYNKTSGFAGEYFSWDVTAAAREWYDGVTNYGIALKCIDTPAVSSVTNIYMSEATSNRPYFYVSYVDMKGIESYFSYSSHSAGTAGSGSVNLANGRLAFSIPTLTTLDSIMPYTPTLIYNSSLSGLDYTGTNGDIGFSSSFAPLGFKMSMVETIVSKSYKDEAGISHNYYVYADSDGTEHGFYPTAESKKYVDENSKQMVLDTTNSLSFELTDDSKWIKTFTLMETTPNASMLLAWYLTKITDKSGNSVLFTYDDALNPTRITKISFKPKGLSAIDMLELYYYTSGKIRMVYNPTSKDAVVFRYSSTYNGSISTTSSSTYLREVIWAHGDSSVTLTNWNSFAYYSTATNITVNSTSLYEYDSSGRLLSVTDSKAAQSINYTWTSNKVTGITQYGGTTEGQTVKFTYGTGYTDVESSGNDENINTTADNIVTTYTFDGYGRATSVYSHSKDGTEIYGATVGTYETQENIKNNIKEQTTLGGSVVNYLLNGDFEETTSAASFSYWTVSGAVSRDASGIEGRYSVKLAPTASGDTASITQYLILPSGDYTLSFPYITQDCSNITAKVTVTSIAGSGLSHSEEISLSENTATGIRSSFSTTFAVPSYTGGGDKVKVIISATATAATASSPNFIIDEVMLENGIGASEYSYVSYGSFDTTGASSIGNILATLSTYWSSNTRLYTMSSGTPFNTSVHVIGDIGSERYVKQRAYEVNLSLYDIYYFSNNHLKFILTGFGMAENASYSPDSVFSLRADIVYYQGENSADVIVSHYFDFLPGVSGWQFTGGIIDFSEIPADQYNSSYDYSIVKAVDIYCEYSYQPNGYALFDNISLVNANGSDYVKYEYYENGLVRAKKNLFYEEYYEYDSNRNLTRVANNCGELTDYYYNTNNQITHAIDYSFTNGQGVDYPYTLNAPDTIITKTPIFKKSYGYNNYGLCIWEQILIVDEDLLYIDGTKIIFTQYTYEVTSGSKIFGALLTEKDASNMDIRYYYDSTNGRLLAQINTDDGTGIAYTYDASGKLTGVTPATYVSASSYTSVTNAENVSYEYNSKNQLSKIVTDSTTYTFTYDVFGNQSKVQVGSNTLATYTYNSYNGKLNKITYGNGYVEEYVYNELELLTEIWYTKSGGTRTLAYEYEYTSDGQVYKFIDHMNGKTTVYKYDTNNRLTNFSEYDSDDLVHNYSSEYSYNDKGELSAIYYDINYGTSSIAGQSYYYTYTTDGKLRYINLQTPETRGFETYTYDEYDRVVSLSVDYNDISNPSSDFKIQTDYTYYVSGSYTSGRVAGYSSSVNGGAATTYTYTYDANGNITKIVYGTGEEIRYYYDDLGQLIREDNELIGETYVYSYDNAGNLIKKFLCDLASEDEDTPYYYNEVEYTYSSSAWGDLLTSFHDTAITYDAIGNPLSYCNGFTFTWTGRQLTGAVKGTKTMSFTYNDQGIRTSKTVNGVTTTYYLDGSRIVGEETNGNITLYFYDSMGLPIGFQYHASTYASGVFDVYWYEKNLQGDIVAIYNHAGTKLVSYKYDAWGDYYTTNATSSVPTAVTNNPFRYRGYYYDNETGLYYVFSRYYDPEIGRWINADGYVSTGQGVLGNNMFAYCGNNPVNRVDYTGQFWSEIWEFAKTAVTEIGKAMGLMSPAYAGCGGAVVADGPLPFGDIVAAAGAALLTVGAIGYGIYQATQAPAISVPKVEEKSEAIVIPKEPDSPVIFPVDPNTFNPVGLVKVPRAGTKNGAFISWMDPLTNTEVFRWDENPNYSNGPHYHIHGTGHYYPGMIVPEPYATIYFSVR